MTRHLTALAALLALLALTIGVAFLPLGAGNPVLSLIIAAAKAGIVAFAFMHLGQASLLVRLTGAAMVLWLGMLIGLTLWVTLAG
jgi:cytochrome c oxidase subunit IV